MDVPLSGAWMWSVRETSVAFLGDHLTGGERRRGTAEVGTSPLAT